MSDPRSILTPKLVRRMQVISTAVALLVSIVLLMFAYMAATRPEHSAAEAVGLVVFAIAFPALIYGGWAIIRWLRRGQEPGAPADALATRLGRMRYLAFVPVAIILGILSFANGWTPHPHATGAAFSARMRDGCISSADSAARQDGSDPRDTAVASRIASYCGCYATEIEARYTPEEFGTLMAAGEAVIDKDEKFNHLLNDCRNVARRS